MGKKSKIEWTDTSWNPIIGCSRVSKGCEHCYAETIAGRFGNGKPTVYSGLTQIVNGRPRWTGQIKETKTLLDPLKWRPILQNDGTAYPSSELAGKPPYRPRRIFVNSMSDLFHENVTDEQRDKIFAVMALCPQHTFQVLTKRPQRMLEYLVTGSMARVREAMIGFQAQRIHQQQTEEPVLGWSGLPMPNVMLGVSVENQPTADERIPLLLETPAAIRFISAEPLLGPLDIRSWIGLECRHQDSYAEPDTGATVCRKCEDQALLDWVICGGESGPRARPMHPAWARKVRDDCKNSVTPFFFKQWGEFAPIESPIENPQSNVRGQCRLVQMDGTHFDRIFLEDIPPGAQWMERQGKHTAGALLDGREWREFPL